MKKISILKAILLLVISLVNTTNSLAYSYGYAQKVSSCSKWETKEINGVKYGRYSCCKTGFSDIYTYSYGNWTYLMRSKNCNSWGEKENTYKKTPYKWEKIKKDGITYGRWYSCKYTNTVVYKYVYNNNYGDKSGSWVKVGNYNDCKSWGEELDAKYGKEENKSGKKPKKEENKLKTIEITGNCVEVINGKKTQNKVYNATYPYREIQVGYSGEVDKQIQVYGKWTSYSCESKTDKKPGPEPIDPPSIEIGENCYPLFGDTLSNEKIPEGKYLYREITQFDPLRGGDFEYNQIFYQNQWINYRCPQVVDDSNDENNEQIIVVTGITIDKSDSEKESDKDLEIIDFPDAVGEKRVEELSENCYALKMNEEDTKITEIPLESKKYTVQDFKSFLPSNNDIPEKVKHVYLDGNFFPYICK